MTSVWLCPLSLVSSMNFLRLLVSKGISISVLVPIQNLAIQLDAHADKNYECYLII